MSHLRRGYDERRMNDENNESVHDKYDMPSGLDTLKECWRLNCYREYT